MANLLLRLVILKNVFRGVLLGLRICLEVVLYYHRVLVPSVDSAFNFLKKLRAGRSFVHNEIFLVALFCLNFGDFLS